MTQNPTKHTKVLIIGSGPAGYTAAVYAARAMLKPILVYGIEPGGQLSTTTDVENYPGFAEVIQGPWLMDQMKEQAEAVGTEMLQDHIKSVDLKKTPFQAVGDSGTIDIIISETNTEIILKVIDSGHGIKTELIDKVFDPLITSKQRGTGLGLASVKNIVEQHNGIISVKNNPTTFTVEIPKRDFE